MATKSFVLAVFAANKYDFYKLPHDAMKTESHWLQNGTGNELAPLPTAFA